jgi:hypothetical protein
MPYTAAVVVTGYRGPREGKGRKMGRRVTLLLTLTALAMVLLVGGVALAETFRGTARDDVECGRDTNTVYFYEGLDQIQGDCENLNP